MFTIAEVDKIKSIALEVTNRILVIKFDKI